MERLTSPLAALDQAPLATLVDQARAFAESARAANTTRLRGRRRTLSGLGAGALRGRLAGDARLVRGRPRGPPEAATIGRRLVAINVYHLTAGYDSPTSHAIVRAVLRGMRRSLGTAPAQERRP